MVLCCLRKREDQKKCLEDETFSCRNGRWKEPWKVEGRRVCEDQTRQVPVHRYCAAAVRERYGRPDKIVSGKSEEAWLNP